MLSARARGRGFTLMELLIGVGIALLLITGLIMVFTSSTKTSTETLQRVRQSQDLRGAMAMMVRDLRRAGYWAHAASGSGAGAAYDNPFAEIDAGTPACISFRYDRNGNGAADASENFGYRLNGNAVEAMTAGDAADCAAAGNAWEAITDAKVNPVSALEFVLSGEIAAVSGGGQIIVRQVGITLKGQTAADAKAAQEFTETVRIRNDLFRP